MEEEQGPNIVSMEGSSSFIDLFFDPLVGLDFEIEIESNSIGNHMMTEEKKDTVMDIISWKSREENEKGGHFMDKVEQTRKEASEDATRESLIAISYRLPEKKDLGPEFAPENLIKSENLVKGITGGDGEEKYRSKLISISYSESPDTKSVPVGPGDIKG
ncbi:hypothetical protein RHMOL_Rhmol01G0207500 [Rhododendron molle]|uniref:Uncharacterized protein n=1 Tax=Rhododendron molle TaxID=49168 RepID=A0ACC0Q516_RHOML|nr:hypothetical protein RHMOL_Rhmol01G0207500 [Rhododendron molle]